MSADHDRDERRAGPIVAAGTGLLLLACCALPLLLCCGLPLIAAGGALAGVGGLQPGSALPVFPMAPELRKHIFTAPAPTPRRNRPPRTG